MQDKAAPPNAEMTEAALLQALSRPEEKQHYEAAGRWLFQHYHSYLLNYLRHNHNLKTEESRDIASQSLANLLQLIREDRYRGEAGLQTLLCKIADYLIRNFLRGKKREQQRIAQYLEQYGEATGASPEYLYLSEELKVQVNRLLNQLGERCRKALRMMANNINYEDIAGRLGYASAGAARVAAFRCRRQLKVLMEKELNS